MTTGGLSNFITGSTVWIDLRYSNKYKFKAKYDPADFNKLKKDKLEYYRQEQKKIEYDKKTVDSLIDAALKNIKGLRWIISSSSQFVANRSYSIGSQIATITANVQDLVQWRLACLSQDANWQDCETFS